MHNSGKTPSNYRASLGGPIATRWYVVEIQKEKSAIAEANLRSQNFDFFHPRMWETVRQFGKQVKRLRPVFPGYCFVHCSVSDGRWRAINSTRGVKRFAGPPGITPVPIRDAIVADLIARCPDGVLDPTAAVIKVGQQVKLEDCAFAGTFARMHELDGMDRVKVLISLLGSDRVVSVPRTSVQPANLTF